MAATDSNEGSPAQSSNGQWLAYVSDETGRNEVWVQAFPYAGETKRQVSTEGGARPVWAHSGRELFFERATNELISVEVVPGPSFVQGEHTTLFSTAPYRGSYDVTADGQRFVMILGFTGGVGDLVVVENFFEELRRLVPN